MLRKHLRWRYKNLTLLGIGILLALLLSQNSSFHSFLLHLGSLGYLGAFVAGILFVLIFTMPIGLVILLTLSEVIPPWEVAALAAIGGVVGDLLILKLVRNELMGELSDLYEHFGGNHLNHLLHTRYFNWTLPVIGAIIIFLPFTPDEIGVSLLGISKIKTSRFIILSFVLDFAGVYATLLAGQIF